MSNLGNQLAIAERHDVARGVRLLLAEPLITARAAPESFELIRRRKDPLTKWFDYYCGWTLSVEPRLGYARLTKVRSDVDDSRPARRLRSGRAAFDRRRYTLLCVVAAELLSAPTTTIGMLADRVKQATAADGVVEAFDTASKQERRAYVDTLRLLESYGALEVMDGSAESFVDSEDAKVLYRVDTTLLMRMLAAPTGPSRLAVSAEEVPARFGELLGEITREPRYGAPSDDGSGTGSERPSLNQNPDGWPTPRRAQAKPRDPGGGAPTQELNHRTRASPGDGITIARGSGTSTETQRNLWARHTVFRKLLDDPVVYSTDLSEAQLAYLSSPTGRQLVRRAATEAGFVLEERAEGWMLVDTDALATDAKFPDDSSNAKVAALLLLDSITREGGAMAPEQLRTAADDLLARYPRWARSYRSDDGADRLVEDATAILTGFGLVRRTDHRVEALPAAARYRVTDTRTSEESQR